MNPGYMFKIVYDLSNALGHITFSLKQSLYFRIEFFKFS